MKYQYFAYKLIFPSDSIPDLKCIFKSKVFDSEKICRDYAFIYKLNHRCIVDVVEVE